MTDLSPREKALVEAVRELFKNDDSSICLDVGLKLHHALRAYDPPKPKIPVLPPWEEFLDSVSAATAFYGTGKEYVVIGGVTIVCNEYNAIRTLTSKEQE